MATAFASAAAAQDQPTEFESWRLPGWTFTPGVIFGALFDSNVAIASAPADVGHTASDKLFGFEPFGQLEYLSSRTDLTSGYHGFLRRYVELNDLDSTDHHAFASLQPLQNLRLLIEPVRWNQDRDRLADRLLRAITENPFGSSVPTLYDASQILADDRIL